MVQEYSPGNWKVFAAKKLELFVTMQVWVPLSSEAHKESWLLITSSVLSFLRGKALLVLYFAVEFQLISTDCKWFPNTKQASPTDRFCFGNSHSEKRSNTCGVLVRSVRQTGES